MGSYGGQPNFNRYVDMLLGGGSGWAYNFPISIGLAFGTNPPYFLDDFLAINNKFFGPPTLVSGATIATSSNVVTLPITTGLMVGQFVQIPGFPKGTIVTSISSDRITVSSQSTQDASNISFTAYEAPPIPLMVIQMYVNLANASLIQSRWQEYWYPAMGLFIAHYCTLYAKSDAAMVSSILQAAIHSEQPDGVQPGITYMLSAAPPAGTLQGLFKNGLFLTPGKDYSLSGATITLMAELQANDKLEATWPVQTSVQTFGVPSTAQLAAQGLMTGIEASKSVGDVSVSYSILNDQEGWGTFRMTLYGAQLIDMAKVVGSGPMLFL